MTIHSGSLLSLFAALAVPLMTSVDDSVANEPVEYVLGAADTVTPRGEYEGAFTEEIVVRGEGERSDRWITKVTTASVTLYLPEGKPSAAAVICPGGGYGGLSFDKEGVYVAKWLCERGVVAGVLKSAVAGDNNTPLGETPLRQAQQAIRFLKQKLGVEVGIVGFSAGGHLAASASNLVSDNSRPAFSALIYPVISMEKGITHGGSRKNLLGASPTDEQIAAMSCEKLVTADTPPAFLVTTMDDGPVPAENSIRYVQACKRADVPAELHIYPTGGHGYGMWRDEGTIANWPAAFEAWLRDRGVIAE